MNAILSSPLGPKWTAGRHGSGAGEAGIRAHHSAGLSILEVAALPGQGAALRAALKAGLDLDLGAGTVAESAVNGVCTGPDRYLLTGFEFGAVKAAVAGLGMVADQSSGRVKLSVDGPAVAAMLSKTCPLNLKTWAVGGAQASHFLHLSCTYFRRSADGFDLYIGRSFAQSAAEWLLDAGAEYGVDVV